MTEVQIWGNKPRAVNDGTLIDEAIGLAVSSHNDDPDAHLNEGQSITTHRAAEIIDHLAESIVNDKLANKARTYVAIVGSGLEGDYDSLESAITYAKSVGGGTIFLCAGDYYLSTKVILDETINLQGVDSDTTVIYTDATNGNYFEPHYGGLTDASTVYYKSLKFIAISPLIFDGYTNDNSGSVDVHFEDCIFKGAGGYIKNISNFSTYTNCIFYLTTLYSICGFGQMTLRDIYLGTKATSGTLKFLDSGPDNECEFVVLDNVHTFSLYTRPVRYFTGTGFALVKIINSTLRNISGDVLSGSRFYITNNYIIINSTNDFNVSLRDSFISNNTFNSYTTYKLKLTSDSEYNIMTNNRFEVAPTNAGIGNILDNNITH